MYNDPNIFQRHTSRTHGGHRASSRAIEKLKKKIDEQVQYLFLNFKMKITTRRIFFIQIEYLNSYLLAIDYNNRLLKMEDINYCHLRSIVPRFQDQLLQLLTPSIPIYIYTINGKVFIYSYWPLTWILK